MTSKFNIKEISKSLSENLKEYEFKKIVTNYDKIDEKVKEELKFSNQDCSFLFYCLNKVDLKFEKMVFLQNGDLWDVNLNGIKNILVVLSDTIIRK